MVEVEWAKLKAHELRALADRDAVVILPVAAMEQHGPHLPVMTDTCIGLEVACRAARALADQRPVVVAPVVWHGLSEHHMPFGGTLTLDHETFFAVLKCLVRSIVRHGFKDILISNSHGGNMLAMNTAADQLAPQFGATIVTTSYVKEAAPEIAALLEDQPHIMHACEGETSMMMALVPELVDASDLASLKTKRERGALEAGRSSYRWRSYTHASANGVSGNPTRANAEKGEKMLDAAARVIAELIADPDTWAPMRDLRGEGTQGVPFRDRKA
jgi:creatinine amidohydrolase